MLRRREQPRTWDWEEARRRLERAQAGLGRWLEPSPEERQNILKARARELAREPREEQEGAGELEVVEFLLAYEKYGIESAYVREVYPLKELTPLPSTPPFVLGVINVRGQILSVMDLKKFFDLPEKGLTDLNKVLIVRGEGMELGILADAILGLRALPLPGLEASLPTLTGIRAEYLRGVTADRLVVLEVKKLLADKRLVVEETAEA